jgi:HAD superfamily hydrolase (TIGR01509 family)
MISAVIFDMDGLMLDTERVAMRAWMSAAAEHRLDLTEAIYHGLIGLGGDEGRRYLRNQSWDDGLVEQVERRAWANYARSLEQEGVPCKQGLFELLDFLDSKTVRRAVATSTRTELAEHKLARVGVLDRFDAIVGGDQVRNGKPAPDIYLRAADRLGCAPAGCVVLEDSRNGVRAAAAAGMTVILVPDLCPIDSETARMALCTAGSLSAVIGTLEGLL